MDGVARRVARRKIVQGDALMRVGRGGRRRLFVAYVLRFERSVARTVGEVLCVREDVVGLGVSGHSDGAVRDLTE